MKYRLKRLLSAGKATNDVQLSLRSRTTRRLIESDGFRSFITAVIIFAGILVGLETFPDFSEKHSSILRILDSIIIWIFIGEMLLKVAAEGRYPWRYLSDPWNVFDACIILGFFLPTENHYFVVLRLIRLLRVMKLINTLPRLKLLIDTLLRSLPSMAYVSGLLALLFYIYGVTGTFLFAKNDPVHFGSLLRAIISMFRIVTLEDWTDIMYIQIYGCNRYGYERIESLCSAPEAMPLVGIVFFFSFVILGAMIVINLFIGVTINNMLEVHYDLAETAPIKSDKTQSAQENPTQTTNSIEAQLQSLQKQLQHIEQLQTLQLSTCTQTETLPNQDG